MGGFAALIGALMVGPRVGYFQPDRQLSYINNCPRDDESSSDDEGPDEKKE